MIGEEIWKDVPGYEGKYQASTLGRIKSVDRVVARGTSAHHPAKGKVLKPAVAIDGYLNVALCGKSFLIHRVVLTTFVGNPPPGYVGMHLNNIKSDNRLINLKWGSQSENARAAIKDSLYVNGRKGRFGADCPVSKPVVQMTKDGTIINEFVSIEDAEKQTKSHSISLVCQGKRKTSGGFRWVYKNDLKLNPLSCGLKI